MMNEEQLRDEIKLFKEHFTEPVLKKIRSLLIGLEVSDEDKKQIEAVFGNKDVLQAVRHRIYQKTTDDVPLGAMNDAWMGMETKLQGASVDMIAQSVKVSTKLIRLFENLENVLKDPFKYNVDLKVNIDRLENSMNLAETATDVMARNLYIRSVDMVMAIVNNLIQKKDETAEQTVERLKKDSTK